MNLYASLNEYGKTVPDDLGFAGLFSQVQRRMAFEPLLAHLSALNDRPRLIPKFFRQRGVGEESLLFFKWQLACFHRVIPEPCLVSLPLVFFEREEAAAYWKWLSSIIVTIIRSAPSSNDPRFNPLALYWGARYLDSLTSNKTPKLVF